jgi:predicted aminopeptidase
MGSENGLQKHANSGTEILFGILFFILLTSCSKVLYLSQAIRGHFRIMGSREPIEKMIETDQLSIETQKKLKMALLVREYASKELGLPLNRSYTVYSKVKDQYVGWNVYCAPEFSVEPKEWCFPIAGCVVYRGYFSKKEALEFAQKMDEKGFDVFISPISAYSTLGWYNDPLLSSHMRLDSIHLSRLIVHELAHQKLYIPGDSRFNEGFAASVERYGVLRWLKSIGRDDQIVQALKIQDEEDIMIEKILNARSLLSEIYHSNSDSKSLSQKKDSIFHDLKMDLCNGNCAGINFLKAGDEDFEFNNAYLVPINTYYSLGPIFQSILNSVDGNLPQFYIKVKELGDLPYQERKARLDSLQILLKNL